MAPREALKSPAKVPISMDKTNVVIKKPSNRTTSDKIPLKGNMIKTKTDLAPIRQRTTTIPKVETSKPKENKPVLTPGRVSKPVKKSSWKRRPKPAHSGVPVPEKMKKLIEKELQEADCSF